MNTFTASGGADHPNTLPPGAADCQSLESRQGVFLRDVFSLKQKFGA